MRTDQMYRMNICQYCKEGIVFDAGSLLWIRARGISARDTYPLREVCREAPEYKHVPDDDIAARADKHILMVVLGNS